MKVLLCAFLLLFSFCVNAAESRSPIVLGLVALVPQKDFDVQFAKPIQEAWSNCGHCELKNLTPYNDKGEFKRSELKQALDSALGQIQILYVAWNERLTADNRSLLESLTKLSQSGVVILGTAGEAQGNDPSHALNKTLLGQVPDALLLGELNEKESLVKKSFYGPEMLTAVKQSGGPSGVAPALFAARLTKDWKKKNQAEWMNHFRVRKTLSKRIWPGVDEFFGR